MSDTQFVTFNLNEPRFSNSILSRAYEAVKRSVTGILTQMQARKSLNALSESQLRDIGLTKHDIFSVTHQVDGSDNFDKIRNGRAGNW